MKAQVMANKGILVSDPSLYDMTPTRWVFEYAGLVSSKEQTWRTTTKTAQDMIVHFLGLDTIPPNENFETGTLSKPGVEYLPLTAFIDPKLFHDTMDKKIRLIEQERTTLGTSPSTEDSMGYDEMVENFDELVPIFDEIFEEAQVDAKLYDTQLEVAKKAQILTTNEMPISPRKPKITLT